MLEHSVPPPAPHRNAFALRPRARNKKSLDQPIDIVRFMVRKQGINRDITSVGAVAWDGSWRRGGDGYVFMICSIIKALAGNNSPPQ
jgi:hypothetical protein